MLGKRRKKHKAPTPEENQRTPRLDEGIPSGVVEKPRPHCIGSSPVTQHFFLCCWFLEDANGS
jgi:hypothetical protein